MMVLSESPRLLGVKNTLSFAPKEPEVFLTEML